VGIRVRSGKSFELEFDKLGCVRRGEKVTLETFSLYRLSVQSWIGRRAGGDCPASDHKKDCLGEGYREDRFDNRNAP
jgi:hypothetical protein